jgi:hypothetical protein
MNISHSIVFFVSICWSTTQTHKSAQSNSFSNISKAAVAELHNTSQKYIRRSQTFVDSTLIESIHESVTYSTYNSSTILRSEKKETNHSSLAEGEKPSILKRNIEYRTSQESPLTKVEFQTDSYGKHIIKNVRTLNLVGSVNKVPKSIITLIGFGFFFDTNDITYICLQNLDDADFAIVFNAGNEIKAISNCVYGKISLRIVKKNDVLKLASILVEQDSKSKYSDYKILGQTKSVWPFDLDSNPVSRTVETNFSYSGESKFPSRIDMQTIVITEKHKYQYSDVIDVLELSPIRSEADFRALQIPVADGTKAYRIGDPDKGKIDYVYQDGEVVRKVDSVPLAEALVEQAAMRGRKKWIYSGLAAGVVLLLVIMVLTLRGRK